MLEPGNIARLIPIWEMRTALNGTESAAPPVSAATTDAMRNGVG